MTFQARLSKTRVDGLQFAPGTAASTHPFCLLLLYSLNNAEVAAGAGHALTVHPETNQIQANLKGKCFSFDKVIPEHAGHADVYSCVRPLVDKFVDGYNTTILAYGQVHSFVVTASGAWRAQPRGVESGCYVQRGTPGC